jgi:prepilin-type N-terminal cleavage/methylation domain-containing protein
MHFNFFSSLRKTGRGAQASCRGRYGPPCGGFTLVEMLTVIAIVVILATISVASLSGLTGAQQFTKEIDQIQGILDQARSYAIAQNTYVWVVFYPVDPSISTPPDNSGDALYVATLASNDGTDPFKSSSTEWSSLTLSAVPVTSSVYSGMASTSQVALAYPVAHLKQIAIGTGAQNFFTGGTSGQIPSLPSTAPTAPTSLTPSAAPSPVFDMTVNGNVSLPVAAAPQDNPNNAQTCCVVQFIPSGAARVSSNPVDAVWINFQRTKAFKLFDANNLAAIRINGMVGLTTVYRN